MKGATVLECLGYKIEINKAKEKGYYSLITCPNGRLFIAADISGLDSVEEAALYAGMAVQRHRAQVKTLDELMTEEEAQNDKGKSKGTRQGTQGKGKSPGIMGKIEGFSP